MMMEPHYQLTTKDHAILQTMLERHRGPHGPFQKLLERKVRDSVIYFHDDIPPGIVTVNSRLTYFADGIQTGPQLIVQNGPVNLPPFALSIHTLRGLALLGLGERCSISVELGSGLTETLTVKDVLLQPEAEARVKEMSRGLVRGDSAGRTGNIVSFVSKAHAAFSASLDPGDDDPGPSAA